MSQMPPESRGSHKLGHLALDPPPGSEELLRRAIESTVASQIRPGNSVTVLRNGMEIFPAMLEAVENARETIDFLTFIYWTGEIAQKFANALTERALAGVRVRVVLDSFGSRPMRQELIERMSAAGVIIERFRPVVRWKFWKADHRTHRKILIVDGEVGFTGGVGIASEWEGDARNPSEWRDTHFRIEGPAVAPMRSAFLTDWRDTGHAIDRTDVQVPVLDESGQVDVAVIDGSAQIGFNDAERAIEALTAAARQRILIQTPYFNPTDAVTELLVDAAARGVNIDLLIPGPHIDKRVSRVMSEKMYLPLLDAGIRVWLYQQTMMHVKAVLVDGCVALVGSINVNRRSVEKDEETSLAIIDAGIARTLEQHFQEDLLHSKPAVAEAKDRPLFRKLVGRLLHPIRREF